MNLLYIKKGLGHLRQKVTFLQTLENVLSDKNEIYSFEGLALFLTLLDQKYYKYLFYLIYFESNMWYSMHQIMCKCLARKRNEPVSLSDVVEVKCLLLHIKTVGGETRVSMNALH